MREQKRQDNTTIITHNGGWNVPEEARLGRLRLVVDRWCDELVIIEFAPLAREDERGTRLTGFDAFNFNKIITILNSHLSPILLFIWLGLFYLDIS